MTNDQEKKKRTLREDYLLIKRAVGIWNEIMPRFWVWLVLCIMLEAVTPYFGIFMSSVMVNELAGDCDPETLLILAVITAVGSFVISVLSRIVHSRSTLKDHLRWHQHEGYLINAQNNLQYEHLENPDVILMRSKIYAAFNATGGGLFQVQWTFGSIVNNFVHIIFAASLTLSMFSLAAEGEFTGILAFINSPFSAVVIVALIAVNTVISIKISADSTIKMNEAVSELAEENTRHYAYNRAWGSDMIIFNLNRIVLAEFRKHQLRPKWIEKKERVQIRFGIISILLNAILNISLFLFVGAKAFIGVFGIGNFILYQGTIGQFITAVSALASEIGKLRHNNVYLEELYAFLDLPNNMYKGSLAVEKRDDIDYEIEFRDVSFKYPRTDNWVLRHVSMKFKIGDKLAIVGENGSGKTTFIKLLCRLYDPTEGKILLNGIDITRYRYDEYMALFSVVFQDYSIFAFSVAENVAASNVYDESRVKEALKRVGLDEKTDSLENGIYTCNTKAYDVHGVNFSGGEQQKIALARALYKDAPFIILDEPTAALDPIAESEVYENFNNIVQEKTSVFISHRLSSCRFCDSIAVFDRGELVQMGSHDVLAADEKGKYSELWHAQAQYYEK